MDSENIIKQLGSRLNIEPKFSPEGVCAIYFDDDEIFFERHENQLYLVSELGTSLNREDTYSRFLEANFMGHECGQGSISIDTNRDQFVLHRLIDGNIDYADFEKILTTFVQATRYWKMWLQNPASNQDKGEDIPLSGIMA